MNTETKQSRVLYEGLDTSFVNLWALLRYLSQRSFIGRVHVELENYTADVFLSGTNTPLVHEVDGEAGTDVVEEAALHRLVLRVRESPGSISVYEGPEEAIAPARSDVEPQAESDEQDVETEVKAVAQGAETTEHETEAATPESMRSATSNAAEFELPPVTSLPDQPPEPANEAEYSEVLRASGELIGGVERAVASAGEDFALLFRESRIALADDYTFLDPMSGHFQYKQSVVTMSDELPASYAAGIAEALRQVVDRLATGERERRTRERVALELARVARKNDDAMTRSGFKAHLDRIAGTKVI